MFSFAVAALLLTAVSAAAAGPNREPTPRSDAADAPGSPLDLRTVSLGQRGTELVLRFRTAGEWEPTQLAAGSGNTLCVRLHYGELRTPRARLCVVDRGENSPGLAYARLDPIGQIVESRIVSTTITRFDKSSITIGFEPSSVNLRQGLFTWRAESTFNCGGCNDVAPDGADVRARVVPLAEPRCFGAASRNPRVRCSNPALRLAVLPTPTEALLTANARCGLLSQQIPYTCQFGVREAVANRTVALVGDSHAAHWRGALEVVAQSRGWRGYSLTRSGCPLSAALPDLPKARRTSCAAWRRAVYTWFTQHPEVRTVFVSQLSGTSVRTPKGTSRTEHQIQGYLRAWRSLPPTVRQIIVLRDVPFSSANTPICVEQAMRRRRRPDLACALPRSRVLRRDAAAIAARRAGTQRVHVVDLTPSMCSPRLCFPVVGGVLVHKDKTHITAMFAATLGPLLRGRIDRLL
ncbi:MAG TPA: SGNH hydrolase domain-containing protein [Solirubrobacteraceae bacterium]|nr:SGNH hydrolase domain-containing protein [Solirubrobacteraceae bacterium]